MRNDVAHRIAKNKCDDERGCLHRRDLLHGQTDLFPQDSVLEVITRPSFLAHMSYFTAAVCGDTRSWGTSRLCRKCLLFILFLSNHPYLKAKAIPASRAPAVRHKPIHAKAHPMRVGDGRPRVGKAFGIQTTVMRGVKGLTGGRPGYWLDWIRPTGYILSRPAALRPQIRSRSSRDSSRVSSSLR